LCRRETQQKGFKIARNGVPSMCEKLIFSIIGTQTPAAVGDVGPKRTAEIKFKSLAFDLRGRGKRGREGRSFLLRFKAERRDKLAGGFL